MPSSLEKNELSTPGFGTSLSELAHDRQQEASEQSPAVQEQQSEEQKEVEM